MKKPGNPFRSAGPSLAIGWRESSRAGYPKIDFRNATIAAQILAINPKPDEGLLPKGVQHSPRYWQTVLHRRWP